MCSFVLRTSSTCATMPSCHSSPLDSISEQPAPTAKQLACSATQLLACSSQSMAVHGSGHSMMVPGSGPSMSVPPGGAGANLVGPLQDKLNRLLLNANSPTKSAGHGSLIAAGRYDNLSASLSQSVKVRNQFCNCWTRVDD